jgi:O-antigen ligase
LTGHGLGSFSQVLPLYADVKTFNSDKAHNDWLEAVFELGWPAALLWFAILGSLALRCLIGFFRRGRDQVYPLVGFCACVLVGLHSLVDFSLQIPGVAVTYSALLGVGIAQSWSSRG